ncbi:HNH endonuclease [Micromonospora sp. NPDC005173]|uniref:HNH endonuclease n=1 Tax=Micromonospora sp. NPDC005173 TaxID=3157165 RepID=UPI0033B8FBA4
MPKPTRDSEADYRLALSKRPSEDQFILAYLQDKVFEAYRKYDEVGGVPHLITAITDDRTRARALQGMYGLTYSGKCLGEISEQAFAAAPYDLCPMCGRVTPTTIDHFLPKNKYPEFSLLSINLIPVCPDCNRYKSTLTGSQDGARFFHAYYDEIPQEVSLLTSQATVERGVVISFFVNDALSGSVYQNARYQFDRLRLGKLYPKASVSELLERYDAFPAAFASGGADGVAREARRIGRGIERKLGRHYWKVALYEGLARSRSFCDGGFALLESKTPGEMTSRLPSTRPLGERSAARPATPSGP